MWKRYYKISFNDANLFLYSSYFSFLRTYLLMWDKCDCKRETHSFLSISMIWRTSALSSLGVYNKFRTIIYFIFVNLSSNTNSAFVSSKLQRTYLFVLRYWWLYSDSNTSRLLNYHLMAAILENPQFFDNKLVPVVVLRQRSWHT